MRSNGKRALVCAHHPPQADRESGSRRTFHFVEFLLRAGWDVSVLASEGAGSARDVRALERRMVRVYDGSTNDVTTIFATERFDLALIAFWSNAEAYLPVIRESSPTTRVIVDSVDLHFLREARHLFYRRRDQASPPQLDATYASRFIREINAYVAADGLLTVSLKEADTLGDLTGDATRVYAVPDCEAIASSTLPFGRRRGMLALGNFQHSPNVQAVEYLCKEILPLVEPALLQAHPVQIVGNALNETVMAYGRGLPYVRMVGWVPSVEPYFEHTRISLVPLLYGAGTKRKLIQSLMSGTPAVSTSVGIEGLNLRDGEHVLVADDPKAFADSITRLLTDATLWRRIARAGRSHIAQAHSPATVASLLTAAIADVLAREAKGATAVLDPRQPQPYIVHQHCRQQLADRMREAIAAFVPAGATLVVVSKGDGELLKLSATRAWHFPQGDDGIYAGHYPADSEDAIAQLEAVRRKGGEFLVLPSTAFWWLEHYDGLKRHLDHLYREVAHQADTCIIYELRRSVAAPEWEPRAVAPLEPPPDLESIERGDLQASKADLQGAGRR